MGAEQEYTSRLERALEAERAAASADARVSSARLAVFLSAALAWALSAGAAAWVIAGVGVVAFVVLVAWHERTRRALVSARADVATLERALARVTGTWKGGGVTADLSTPEAAAFAADLDLFGPGSLFDLMCTAEGPAGQGVLARWLCIQDEVDGARARQEAAREAAPDVDLRLDVARAARGARTLGRADGLLRWAAEAPRGPRPGHARAAAVATLAVGLVGALAWPTVGAWSMAPWLVCLAGLYAWAAAMLAATRPVDRVARELTSLTALFSRLEGVTYAAPWWVEALGALREEGGASAHIARLERDALRLDAMKNALFAPVGIAVGWPVFCAAPIERWRRAHGARVVAWLEAVARAEAMLSLAAFTYERSGHAFPELVGGGPELVAEELGHPLLGDECVGNDVSLGAGSPAWLVSGSNMAGKSTLLRAVGVNVVLALAGAPVRARSMRLTRLVPAGTLRVQDSLEDGRSRFFAELERLKHILDQARSGEPVVFLVDEILHGTNSRDRQVGAVAYARALLVEGAIGMITTHDLTISERARELDVELTDVHLADEVTEDGEWTFDYMVRAGPVQGSNALAWLKAVGMDIV